MDVAQGSVIRLPIFYVLYDGTPVDPVGPTVDVLDPGGATIVDAAAPVRDALGVYHYDYDVADDAELGEWSFIPRGTIAGADVADADSFTVVPPGEADEGYGANLGGVRSLLPDVVIDSDSKPSSYDVTTWLEDYAATVASRLGDLTVLDDVTRGVLYRRARNVVHLAAAAQTEDAVHPNGADVTEASYGTVLWNRYEKLLDGLAADAMILVANEPDAPNRDKPAGSYPRPTVLDTVRW